MRHCAVLVIGLALAFWGQACGDEINHARAYATDNYGAVPPHTVDNWGPLAATASAADIAPDLTRGREATASSGLVYDPVVAGDLLSLGAWTRVFTQSKNNLEKSNATAYWYDTLSVQPRGGNPAPQQVLLEFELGGSSTVANTMSGESLAKVVVNGDAGASVKLVGNDPASNPILGGSWSSTDYTLTTNPGDSSLTMAFRGTLSRLVDVSAGPAAVEVQLQSQSWIYLLSDAYKEAVNDFAHTLTLKRVLNPDGTPPQTWDWQFQSGMVPEPSTWANLAALALLGLLGYRWKRKC